MPILLLNPPTADTPGATSAAVPPRAILDLRGQAAAAITPDTTALLLDGSIDRQPLHPHLAQLKLVLIHFANHTDGRGFSLARWLKNQADFHGQLRACGHLIIDQYQYLQRCGFDQVDVPATAPPVTDWPTQAGAFNWAYQSAAAQDPLSTNGHIRFGPARD